jgi:hypothetical protein
MATGEESTVRKCCTRLGFSDGVGGQLADWGCRWRAELPQVELSTDKGRYEIKKVVSVRWHIGRERAT